MQFFAAFTSIIALAAVVVGSPIANESNGVSSSIISDVEFEHWLATTDAELTFIGERPNPLAPRSAQTTRVTYCNKRVASICGGTCTVYNGGATCLDAAGTTCIAATQDVGFCDVAGCDGNCGVMSECGTQMGSGFCFTPNTKSILVSTF